MSPIDYRPIVLSDYEAVRQFLAGLGWDRRVSDPARFAKMMARADRTVLALDDGRVVGCVRALCDGVSNGYISMLAVAADRRGQGIGRELLRRLMAPQAPGDTEDITWVLRAGHDSQAFWEKMGFARSEAAMERLRRGGDR
jgi:N-acetylglutamate synthase-like GNAT family acetyltransferase